ncbi:MAG: glycosyltransferase family 39 protein [Clostridiaceae bacterium]|nr:glycosyltransferase family 39 protein [Clostridiaceae bacterium]
MEKLREYLLENGKHYIILFLLAVVLFWKIGTYPNHFDACVEHAIHPQVNKVLDNQDVSKEVTWVWTDMYQHAAGRSPLYSGPIELGLRLFGLTLFGVRFITAVLAFIILVLLYHTMRKYYHNLLAGIFILLLASSPWYLIMTRSGGIIGFSLTLVLLALCLVAIMFTPGNNQPDKVSIKNKKKSGRVAVKPCIIAFLAGVSVAFLPYGHAMTRPLPIMLIIWILLYYKKIGASRLAIFLTGVFAVASIQFTDLRAALRSYFNARGEGLLDVAKSLKSTDPDFLITKLISNIREQFNFLFGLNSMEEFWDPNIAYSYWKTDIVLYPRFLVPFFVIGFILCLINIYRKRSLASAAPVLFLFVTLIPGLMAGYGGPNAARNYLSILPLYFFIAYAFYSIFSYVYNKVYSLDGAGLKSSNYKRYLTVGLSVTIIGIICVYQVNNFFNREKGALDEKYTPAHSIYEYLNSYFEENESARVLIHEIPIFGNYSYVTIRWLGGKEFEDRLESGQVMLLKYENRLEVENLWREGYFDLLLSSSGPDELKFMLSDFESIEPEDNHKFMLYRYK